MFLHWDLGRRLCLHDILWLQAKARVGIFFFGLLTDGLGLVDSMPHCFVLALNLGSSGSVGYIEVSADVEHLSACHLVKQVKRVLLIGRFFIKTW